MDEKINWKVGSAIIIWINAAKVDTVSRLVDNFSVFQRDTANSDMDPKYKK